MDRAVCDVCGKVFTRFSNLSRHVRILHSESDPKPFKCNLCDFKTPFRYSLLKHVKKHDEPADASKLKQLCVLCGFSAVTAAAVEKHYNEAHNVRLEAERVTLSSKAEFDEWKTRLENAGKCQFAVRNTNKTKGRMTVLFCCFRSGFYKSRRKSGVLRRSMKSQGSNKINGHCPAKLEVVFLPGVVNVLHVKTHLGHDNDLSRLRLSKLERDEIAKQISMEIPFDDILTSVRASAETKDIERLKLLSRKDLHNIARDYKLTEARPVKASPYLHSLVEDLQESNFVAFYKPEGRLSPEFPLLLENDFLLILMSETQISNLSKFGNNAVCVDSFRREHSHGVILTTLLVLGENSALPCAFMFSYRMDLVVSEIFFRTVRDKVGTPLRPTIFTSDFIDDLEKGWVKFHNPPKNRWFCSWHVERAVKKILRKSCLREREKQATLKSVMDLVDVTDVSVFHIKLNEAVNLFLSDSKTHEFGKQFEKWFLPIVKNWALCYQVPNTTRKIEKFHFILKQIDQNGMRPRRLDLAVENLVKFVDDSYDRGNRGKRPSMAVIKQRHKLSLKLNVESVILEDGMWKMSDGKELYKIKRGEKQCMCDVKCGECGVCVHAYTCTCGDSTKSFMCQHVHFIHKFHSDVVEAKTPNAPAARDNSPTQPIRENSPPPPIGNSPLTEKTYREEELWSTFVELMNSARTADDLQKIGRSLEQARTSLSSSSDSRSGGNPERGEVATVAIGAQQELLLVLHN